ncbi:MAG: ABC transporter permease [Pseudobdellovibrio sp.]
MSVQKAVSNQSMISFLTLIKREVKRFLKVIIQTVVSPIISSSLYLLIFGVSLGSQVTLKNGIPYISFLIPGLMVMGLINNSFQNSSSSIVTSKFSGDLEDLRVAPVTNNQIIWAMGIGGIIRGSSVALITGIVGWIFDYFMTGEVLKIAHPVLFLMYLAMGGLIFSFCGIFVAFLARTFDQLSAFSTFILIPLTYLGGVFMSIEGLHPFWQKICHLNPVFYLINGFRYSILGVSDVQVELTVGVSFIALIITYLMAKFSLEKGSFSRW